MRAWNRKHKPKHWVVCHWDIYFEEEGTLVIYLLGKFKPKRHPYPKRRYLHSKYYCRNYDIKKLSRREVK